MKFLKHHQVPTTNHSPLKLDHFENDKYSPYPVWHSPVNSVYVVHCKQSSDLLQKMRKHETVEPADDNHLSRDECHEEKINYGYIEHCLKFLKLRGYCRTCRMYI